jgi:hypothetical protein
MESIERAIRPGPAAAVPAGSGGRRTPAAARRSPGAMPAQAMAAVSSTAAIRTRASSLRIDIKRRYSPLPADCGVSTGTATLTMAGRNSRSCIW